VISFPLWQKSTYRLAVATIHPQHDGDPEPKVLPPAGPTPQTRRAPQPAEAELSRFWIKSGAAGPARVGLCLDEARPARAGPALCRSPPQISEAHPACVGCWAALFLGASVSSSRAARPGRPYGAVTSAIGYANPGLRGDRGSSMSRLQEGQQVGVDGLRLRRGHAMREAAVGLQRPVPDKLCRQWPGVGVGNDLIVIAMHH